MGFIAPSRFPEQFPFTGYLTQLALVGDDGLAASAAMTELLLLHCPPCSDEFLGQNLVFLGTYSAVPYVLMSKQPIGAPPALQGRPIYAPGSLSSEEHTSELQSLMRTSYAVFCLKQKINHKHNDLLFLIQTNK